MDGTDLMTRLFARKYRRRLGTDDEGRNYEDLVTASLALNFTLDEKIIDFNIKSNEDDYGAFDDVVFQVEKSGSKKNYCMQLKYKKSNKKVLPKDALNAPRGEYALRKYCTDYYNIINEKNIEFTGILLVRAQFTCVESEVLSNDVCKYRIAKIDDTDDSTKLCKNLFDCVCYRFVIVNDPNTSNSPEVAEYKHFFKNFILCVTSASTSDIEKNIGNVFESHFLQQSASVNFIDFIKNLTKQAYSLRKQMIRYGITLSVLDQHVCNVTFNTDLTELQRILMEIILQYTVTQISNIDCIDFGKETKNKMTETNVQALSNLFKFEYNDVDKRYAKALWLEGNCAMVVKSSPAALAAIKLSLDLKYILIEENSTEMESINSFKNLADLKRQNFLLYKKVVNTFDCKFQTKQVFLKSLVELDPNVLQLITTNKLLEIAYKKLHIDNVNLELPKIHITPRYFFVSNNFKSIKSISETDLVSNEHKFCIISAKSGMGKTTIAKHLVYISQSNLWSVFLNAPNLSEFLTKKHDSLEEFEKYLLEKQKQNGNGFDYDLFKIFLKNGAIRFLWDGVDEVNDDNFVYIKSLIKQLQHDKTVHYITTRPHLLNNLEREFEAVKHISLALLAFDKIEQLHYVQHTLNLSPKETEEIILRIETNIASINRNDILGIPLQIFMITELLKQERVTGDDINHRHFTLDTLYEYFVYEKLKVFFVEKLKFDLNVDRLKEIIDDNVSKYTTFFKKLSAGQYFTNTKLDVECDSKMIESIRKNGDPTGFILKLDYTSELYFFHKSMSEFFAAQFLFDNLNKLKKRDFMALALLKNIQFFFDLMLAKKCNAHIAALNKNWGFFDECPDAELNKVDKVGRNVLQVIIVSNKEIDCNNYFCDSDTIHISCQIKFLQYRTEETMEMIKKIRYLTHRIDLSARDTISNADTFDYLNKTKFFLLIGIIYVELASTQNQTFKKLTKLFEANKNDIIASCLLYDYCDILNVLEDLPFFEDVFDGSNLVDVLLYYKCSNWLKKLTCDKSLKCNTHFELLPTRNWQFLYKDLVCYDIQVNNTLARDVYEIMNLIISIDKNIINQKDDDGKPLFLMACKLVLTETIDLLLKNGVDIQIADEKGKTCLYYATKCVSKHKRCCCVDSRYLLVKTLLEKKACVNVMTQKGVPFLLYACSNGRSSNLLELLLIYNADINSTDSTKSTVLHYASKNQFNVLEMVEFLIQKGCLINSQNSKDDTPLHFAVDTKIADCLIKNGANVNSNNKNGQTPLHSACLALWTNRSLMELLLENKADINIIDNQGYSVLHSACLNINASVETIDFFLEKGIAINCRSKDRDTPLHLAVKNCKGEIVDCLIRKGANVNSVNKKGQIPLDHIDLYDDERVYKIQLLRKSIRL